MAQSNNQKRNDAKKPVIKLEGERSGHVEKLVNELGTWGFFKYLYGKSLMKVFGINLLILILFAPVILLSYFNVDIRFNTLSANFSDAATVGLGGGSWMGFNDFYQGFSGDKAVASSLWYVAYFAVAALIFAGVFAVIRDAFWTGKLNILKPFFAGIAQSFLYMLPFMLALGAACWGLSVMFVSLTASVSGLTYVLIQIVAWTVFCLAAMYVMILFGIVAVHKQDFSQSMRDAGRLFSLNLIPNLFAFIISFAPTVAIAYYFPLMTSRYGSFIFIAFLIIGFFYVPYVWMTHMMKTFRLFHPVEKKRIK